MYKSITPNIMVENVKETIEFYTKILGFELVLTVPEQSEILNFAIVKKDSITLMFESKEALTEEYSTLTTEKIIPCFTLFITATNIDKLYIELKDKVKLALNMHQTFYGKKEFAIFDNNNNILTISE